MQQPSSNMCVKTKSRPWPRTWLQKMNLNNSTVGAEAYTAVHILGVNELKSR